MDTIQRIFWFVLFLIAGSAIYVFGSGYFNLFPTNNNLLYLTGLSTFFLIIAIVMKQTVRFEKYWQTIFAFFTACAALSFSTLMARYTSNFLKTLGLSINNPHGFAIAKTYEMVMIVVPIIALTKLSGMRLGSIYWKRGNLRLGLGIGVLLFFNFATSALLFFTADYSNAAKLGVAIQWGLVFSFANSFMEETWMRSIFLRRLESIFGIGGAVFLTSLLFALAHVGAVYISPAAIPIMLVYTITLGIGCGYLTIKADSIWGGTLIHAAADLFLFISLFRN